MSDNKRLNICRIVYEFPPPFTGGSKIHIVGLAERIEPFLNRQFVIAPKADEDTTSVDRQFTFEVYRVKYLKLRLLRWFKLKFCKCIPLAPLVASSYSISACFKTYMLNRKHGIDIIHAHGYMVGCFAVIAGAIMCTPVVWTIHGTGKTYSKKAAILESMLVRVFKPNHAMVLFNGSEAIERFTRFLGSDKVTPFYHGIDVNEFSPQAPNTELKSLLGIEGNFVCITVHTLLKLNGVDYAIKGFAKFVEMSGDEEVRLLIIGDGNHREELEKLVSSLHIKELVVFLGSIPHKDIKGYYSISDVALSTSPYTNINNSSMEAMACGKPLAIFDSDTNTPDMLIKDMETVVSVKSSDVENLANKILLLYQNPELRKKIGENARSSIKENRSWSSRVNVDLDVYKNIIDSTP